MINGNVGRASAETPAESLMKSSLIIAGQVGSNVKVTLEIHAELPDGAPHNVVRTVTENCRTLKFKDQGFEES